MVPSPGVTLPLVSDRDDLLKVINDKAVVRGDFVLSSGQRASWYIDLRRVLLSGASAALAGRVMLAVTADLGYDAVGGLTLGADPVATAMMHAAFVQGKNLDAFVVRKSEKAHGLQRRIEGPDVAGRRVLAVEDTSTTGASVLTAVDALRGGGRRGGGGGGAGGPRRAGRGDRARAGVPRRLRHRRPVLGLMGAGRRPTIGGGRLFPADLTHAGAR